MDEKMKLNSSILREYDIRGIVGETIGELEYKAIGKAFGTQLRSEGGESIAVCYDGRLSSPALESAIVEGLMSTGSRVVRVGRGPSPMCYFASHHIGTDAALMVTGSHNPPNYNGIKMNLLGRAFYGADIEAIGARVAAGDYMSGEGQIVDVPILDKYVERLIKDFSGHKKLRVAWDPGNGAAGEVIESLVARLPGRHFIINGEIDGRFPNHHPDPTVETNLEQLKRIVDQEGCDLGLAFDGDGDRIGVVDGQGRVLWGDQVLVILARPVLAELPGATIICDIKASQLFQQEINRLGGKPLLWKTGHSHLKTKLAETGAPLAGEMSAHIFFKHRYYGYDDAIYSAVRLLDILCNSEENLAEIRDSLPVYVNTPEIRFDCPEDRKFAVIEEVRERLAKSKGCTVNNIDGVRVENEHGWWLLRASNTQAVLVARCESVDRKGLAATKEALVSQLRLSGIEPPVF